MARISTEWLLDHTKPWAELSDADVVSTELRLARDLLDCHEEITRLKAELAETKSALSFVEETQAGLQEAYDRLDVAERKAVNDLKKARAVTINDAILPYL